MRTCSVRYHETLDLNDSVDISLIDPPKYLLRDFREDLDELVSSIREKGLIQPIVIRPTESRFEVVAGARRLEACKRLRWTNVPCIIHELSDREAYEIALTENLQRKTMNAIEEALAFRKYLEQSGWGGQTVLATKIGKSQEYISERLSLLSLPSSVQEKIIGRQINPSVGIEIAKLNDSQFQVALSDQAFTHGLTVRDVREAGKMIRLDEDPKGAFRVKRQHHKKRRKNSYPGSGYMTVDESEPEFTRNFVDREAFTLHNARISCLDNSILTLKIAIARLAQMIDDFPYDDEIKDILFEKRLVVHDVIDSLIKYKMKILSTGQSRRTTGSRILKAHNG